MVKQHFYALALNRNYSFLSLSLLLLLDGSPNLLRLRLGRTWKGAGDVVGATSMRREGGT